MVPQLPSEIWEHILEYAGSAFFQADIQRLTVSKTWRSPATHILYRDLRLTPSMLWRLTQLPSTHPAFKKIRQNLESLHLSLHGFKEWETALSKLRASGFVEPVKPEEPPRPASDLDEIQIRHNATFWIESHEYRMSGFFVQVPDRPEFIATLNQSLEFLWDKLRNASRLTQIYIDSELESCPDWYPGGNTYLHERALRGICGIPTVTTLHLDLNGTDVDRDILPPNRLHLCHWIRELLPQLTRVRIRLHKLCPSLLSISDMIAEVNPNLVELVINVSLDGRDTDDHHLMAKESSRCDGGFWGYGNELAELESQMVLIAQQLKGPERVQAIYRMASEEQNRVGPLRVFDALKVEYFQVKSSTSWAEGGEYITSYGFDWEQPGFVYCGNMFRHSHMTHRYMNRH